MFNEELKKEYLDLWKSCFIKPAYDIKAHLASARVSRHKFIYECISAHFTGLPWFVIGVIHKMESNCNMTKHLHNGDPLTARTVQVPSGHPKNGEPPFTFEESAVDAIIYDRLDRVTDWTIPSMLYHLEKYNGLGYRKYHKDVLSPYLWSGTNHYTSGKYVADGKWDSKAISAQIGCVPIIMCLFKAGEIKLAI